MPKKDFFDQAADLFTSKKAREPMKAAGSAAAGAAAGAGAVAVTGMTMAGMAGGGAGIGAAAGPVGIAAGAVIGLAAYGVYRAFFDESERPERPKKGTQGEDRP